MVLSRMILERATRECITSPQIAITSPRAGPLLRRMVRASSSRLVGCSWAPLAGIDHGTVDLRSNSSTAPEAWCRTTRMSGCMAFSVTAVSIRVPPPSRRRTPTCYDVGTQPFARRSRTRIGVRSRLEEQVVLVRPRQARAASCRPGGLSSNIFLGGSAGRHIVSGKPLDSQQVPVPRTRSISMQGH